MFVPEIRLIFVSLRYSHFDGIEALISQIQDIGRSIDPEPAFSFGGTRNGNIERNASLSDMLSIALAIISWRRVMSAIGRL